MSLFGALSASLTSLTAQSKAVNVISNNISNLNSTGFKSTNVSFSTLVAGTIGGGVLDSLRQNVDAQGAIQSTGVGTDLAVQGNGFFSVQDTAGNTLFTRAGSFRTNSSGELVNEAGYVLMGWPLDSESRLPGESGNTTYTRSAQDLVSLVPISTSSITGTASPTTAITAKINLRAEEDILEGPNGTVNLLSLANTNNNGSDIIVPSGFARGATFSVATGTGSTFPFTYGGFAISDDINAGSGIGGVTNANAAFVSAPFVDGAAFTVSVDGSVVGTYTFRANPNANINEFRSLGGLADLIDSTEGLQARISNGTLYVSPDDANSSMAFADLASSGVVTALGMDDAADNFAVDSTGSRFASLTNLADAINTLGNGEISASVLNPTGNSTLKIINVDPTDTLTFTDSLAGDNMLAEFQLSSSQVAAVYEAVANTGKNMASGAIPSDFSRTITVYTSLGEALDLRLAFVKIQDDDNGQVWATELYAADPDAVSNSVSTYKNDGLLSYGTIAFNGDGSLKSISGPIGSPIDIDPAGGASTQSVSLRLGTAGDIGQGKADGLSQFAGQYSVDTLSQNGFPTGRLQALQIDANGFVTAIFDNSLSSKVYKLPLAFFSNPNGLTQESGNAFATNSNAGAVTLGQVGDASVGTIVPGALEVSTAEIGYELTKLIVSQQAYGASANVLRKVTELFDELKQI